MRRLFFNFLSDENGTTAIEYALIAAGVALVIVTAVSAIGDKLNTGYTSVSSALP